MSRMLAVGILALSASVATAALAEPVKVGMITTLSGGLAGLGIEVRDGFLLALKQSGNKDVQLVIEDDNGEPARAVQLAEKVIKADKVDVLTGILYSNLAMAVVPGVVGQKKFYLSPNAGPSPLAGAKCSPFYFNVSWQNDAMHEAMGNYSNEAGYKKMFILAPNYPAGTDALRGFKRYYKGELAGELYTKLGQTDYAAEIAQIRASGADAVYFFLPGDMSIAFMKQYAQAGVKLPITGPGFSLDQDVLGAMGDIALGVKNTSQWSEDLDNPANKAFVEGFKAEYKRRPSIYASQGYDTANLLLSAVAKASVKDAAAFRAALEAADFKSVRGSFRFGLNHHPIQDVYVRDVVKVDGALTNKLVSKTFTAHQDAYVKDCKM
ncbi:branched-chain amino acid transport system substrate-binding protein [Bosea sp. CRIB-10]|uniref:ABC transporter substrate-binding protein n=1 Tax=Bosea sp. CRIB-10 TaxID=378404 RepID=UPI0008F3DB43|nr:ABC transporter substrate-binding protein [Bosea sp. CRIB-10]SFB78312.1 branched-chain amino acid transport system substrate-binding protein [Bosea sp. CRIB-10]